MGVDAFSAFSPQILKGFERKYFQKADTRRSPGIVIWNGFLNRVKPSWYRRITYTDFSFLYFLYPSFCSPFSLSFFLCIARLPVALLRSFLSRFAKFFSGPWLVLWDTESMAIRDVCICIVYAMIVKERISNDLNKGKVVRWWRCWSYPGVGFAKRGLISLSCLPIFASGKDILYLKWLIAGSALFPFFWLVSASDTYCRFSGAGFLCCLLCIQPSLCFDINSDQTSVCDMYDTC